MTFETFFALTYKRVVSAIYLVVGSLAEAEDIAQEAYLRASQHWDKISEYDNPEAWVRRVGYHLALDSLARTRRRAAALLRRGQEDRPSLEVTHAPELAIDLHRALARIPLRYRAVLTLHYLLDLPIAEIADQLQLPTETVRTHLRRGRQRLEAALDENPPHTTCRPDALLASMTRRGHHLRRGPDAV